VAQVGLGVVVHKPEADDDRQVSGVGLADRVFERVIEARALRLLPPVEHEAAAAGLPLVEALDPCVLDHRS
jgi:hypothetical protein